MMVAALRAPAGMLVSVRMCEGASIAQAVSSDLNGRRLRLLLLVPATSVATLVQS